MRLWLTELGHIGNNLTNYTTPTLDRTWLEGVFSGVLLLLMVREARFDIITPYCLVCGDQNSYSFTTVAHGQVIRPASLAGHVDWVPTPQGAMLSLILNAVRAVPSGGTMQELGFNPTLLLPPPTRWGHARQHTNVFPAARVLSLIHI